MSVKISWPDVENVGMVGVAIVGYNNEYVFGSNTGTLLLKGVN